MKEYERAMLAETRRGLLQMASAIEKYLKADAADEAARADQLWAMEHPRHAFVAGVLNEHPARFMVQVMEENEKAMRRFAEALALKV